jgi:hypothetical protein
MLIVLLLEGCSMSPFRSGASPTAPSEAVAVATDSTPTAPAEAVAEAADSTGTVAQPPETRRVAPEVGGVQVELSETQRRSLAAEATKDLEHAEHVLVTYRKPRNSENGEKLDTIRTLVDAARAAYDQDLRAAATLAHKARLLAAELAGK